MAFDLTNTKVSNTFQHLLQVRDDDKTIYDAVGNVLDDFRLSGSFTTSEFLELENSDNVAGNKLHSREGVLYWGNSNLQAGGGISEVSDDLTPQLGGNLDINSKDVVEQVLNKGFDCVLIDSIAEVVDSVRDDNKWDRKTAESWLVDTCVKNNKGENKKKKFTSFLLIQQVTKAGEFVGSNKLKHMTDAMLEIRRESDRDGGGTYLEFTKNRNGSVNQRLSFTLSNTKIDYGMITGIE